MTAARENKEALMIPDDTRNPVFQRIEEEVLMEENTTIIKHNTYADSFILGSASNGILGTNILGDGNRVLTVVAIVNTNNVFRERFRDTTFEDGNTTADWADVVGTLVMTSGEVAVSESCALNDGTKISATITIELSSGSLSDITIQLSSDGTNFETVTEGTLHSFTDTGTDLKFKLTASGNVTVTLVKIAYN